jgi:hypothetical protein
MEIINKMDEESREKLRKKELQVYTRQRSAPKLLPVTLGSLDQGLLHHLQTIFLLVPLCQRLMT